MEQHKVKTHHAPHCKDKPWTAAVLFLHHENKKMTVAEAMTLECRLYDEADRIGYGQTEVDACVDLARRMNLKLWNEQ